MTRPELIHEIAARLLDEDMLNEADYNFDTEVLLKDVENTIWNALADYIIISGRIL